MCSPVNTSKVGVIPKLNYKNTLYKFSADTNRVCSCAASESALASEEKVSPEQYKQLRDWEIAEPWRLLGTVCCWAAIKLLYYSGCMDSASQHSSKSLSRQSIHIMCIVLHWQAASIEILMLAVTGSLHSKDGCHASVNRDGPARLIIYYDKCMSQYIGLWASDDWYYYCCTSIIMLSALR